MRRYSAAVAVLALSALSSTPAIAKDNLLDTLAQKGILTPEEYEKLKKQQKSEVIVDASEGFKITSADGANSLQVGTLLQLDYSRYSDDKADLADGSELRRSRLSTSGVLLKDWQYRFEYEFSGTTGVTDAYVVYNVLKPFIVTVGQFKQPIGMEALASDKNVTFMERGLPFAFIPPRAPGVMLGSSGYNWSVSGAVSGEPVGNAGKTGDQGYGVASRITYAPLLTSEQMIHVGLGASWRKPSSENSTAAPKFSTVQFRSKPESDVLAQRFVDTGEIKITDQYGIEGLELAGACGPASFQSEYHFVQVKRDIGSTLNFSGWYAQLAYTLTGEMRPYKADKGIFDGIRPMANLGKDGWGAFEVAARLSDIDLSDANINGGKERNIAAALNWYLNPFLRVSANIVKVLNVEGGVMNGDEPTVFQIRTQLAL